MLVIGGRGGEVGDVLQTLETQEVVGGRRRPRQATRRDVLSYASESAAAKNGDW